MASFILQIRKHPVFFLNQNRRRCWPCDQTETLWLAPRLIPQIIDMIVRPSEIQAACMHRQCWARDRHRGGSGGGRGYEQGWGSNPVPPLLADPDS